jgi:hypothetical protein
LLRPGTRWLPNSTLMQCEPSNHAMQPTTGRRTTKISMTRTSTPATPRALASGG